MKYLLSVILLSGCVVMKFDSELTDHFDIAFSPIVGTQLAKQDVVYKKLIDDSVAEGLSRLDTTPVDNYYVDYINLSTTFVSDVVKSNTTFAGINRLRIDVIGLNRDDVETKVYIVDHTFTAAEQAHNVLYLNPISSDLAPAIEALRAKGAELEFTFTVIPSQVTLSSMNNDLTVHLSLKEKVSL
jgi:hypothetical protein